jgi:hypothetical protein
MKKILLSLVVTAGVSIVVHSKVLTVSNNTNSPGQYKDVQAACDAASSYDTIYIHASEFGYGNVDVRKPLILIGEGALPNQQIKLETKIGAINFTHATEQSSIITSSGSKVFGIYSNFNLRYNKEGIGLSNFTFERCKGSIMSSGSGHGHSYLYINHFVGMISGTTFSNMIVSNSIINNLSFARNGNSNLVSSNNVFRNCIFGSYAHFHGALISNNIFYAPSENSAFTTSYSTFNNNIFYLKDKPTLSNLTTTETGNLFNVDPIFENPESFASQVRDYNFESKGPHANFKLKTGSPALTLGTDGTQAGIYGGTTPWIDGGEGVLRYHTMPRQVPYVTDMDILNSSILENGTLNVNIKAKVQD